MDMEPKGMPVEGSQIEELAEGSAQEDFETLSEAEAIKADPARVSAVQAFAKEQGLDVPGMPSQKSMKDSIKGMGSSLMDSLGKGPMPPKM